MFEVKLYKFAKRNNSTKLPPSTGALTMECLLKAPANILAPTLKLRFGEGSTPESNYAYIPAFKRYYFINNWTWGADGCWHASLSVDVLASWRTEIRNHSAYVLRAASAYNGEIPDMYYPIRSNVTTAFNNKIDAQSTYNWQGGLGAGSYVVGIINSDAQGVGTTSYYVFTQSNFRQLSTLLLSEPSTYLGITDITDNLQKALFNPFQYIAGAMWFPFQADHQAEITALKFGWWQFSVPCAPISATGVQLHKLVFSVPQHPQAGTRGVYLNGAPWSERYLYIPSLGEIELPDAVLQGNPTFAIDLMTDLVTGICTMIGSPVNTAGTLQPPLFNRQTTVGVPVQISSIVQNMGGTLGNAAAPALTAAAQAVDKYLFGGGETASTLVSTWTGSNSSVSTIGGDGNVSQYGVRPYLRGVFHAVADEHNSDCGRPLCMVKTLGDLSGYVQCLHTDISTPATSDENTQIGQHLVNGLFME